MIHVAIAADQNVVAYIPGLVRSILSNTQSDVTFHLLLRQCRVPNINAKVVTYNLGGYLADQRIDLQPPHVTLSSMDRIFLPELVQEARVIYLDVDTIVLADLAALWKVDAGPKGVAAKASFRPDFATVANTLRRWGYAGPSVPKDWAAFNCGVLLFDLVQLRLQNFVSDAMELIRMHKLSDQPLLQVWSEGRFTQLDPEWNVFVGQDDRIIKSPKILHWVGPRKPWHRVSYAAIWDKYQTSEGY